MLVALLLSGLSAPVAGSSTSAGKNVYARPALCVGTQTSTGCEASAAVANKKATKQGKKCTAATRKHVKNCVTQARSKTMKKSNNSADASSSSAGSLPDGYGPAQFRSAYGLPSAAPRSQTIAIVTASDSPNIEQDLRTYSTTFSLPACSSANGCLRKVNGAGATAPLPSRNALWALETSLDVEVAHAVCPNCKILLVEASSGSVTDLVAAVDTAVKLGADVISNSWVVEEFRGETALDWHFNRPGITIAAASGDTGYGVKWPAASSNVVAVGGTTLDLNSSNARVSETAWELGGSGCSAYESKPAWQADSGCANRTVPDVAAVADPATGAAVYDSYGYSGRRGWFRVGGTSLSTPIVAAIYALAGNADTVVAGSHSYANASSLFDVKQGSNGTCSPVYLCTAASGYDGPSGLGSPQGTQGF